MNHTTLRELSENIRKTMESKRISVKDLAKNSGISYSTLTPIINGSRDFGVLKLLAIADALGCTPNNLLTGLFNPKISDNKIKTYAATPLPNYLAIFISEISVTYLMLYDLKSQNKTTSVLQFSLGCSQNPETFLNNVVRSIKKAFESLTDKINFKDIAIFASVQEYEGTTNREKIQKKGNHYFSKFIIESDAITNYRAFLGNTNGICISINDGNAITYSTNKGKYIKKLQGYGFPISDIAGNYWIGCEAIKHAINVKENIEPSSLLSDKILALFNDDLIALSEFVLINPGPAYLKASSIVKELMHNQKKSYEIVKKSFGLLMDRIKAIDTETKTKLPIFLAGDLAHIYEKFFPQNRIIKLKHRHNVVLLDYGIKILSDELKINL